ncbi:MAG TPA: acyltransferase [Anaerolineales bacterium]|nr:acyltransferase [Anaerolineales bacterium]
MESKPRFYLPELDGLRFIAFLLVFIHNAPSISSSKIWTALHEYGWVGVDLFFCLSGFLITKLLLEEYQKIQAIKIRFFYVRRMLRILPLYFFFVATTYLVAFASNNIGKNPIFHISALVFLGDNFATAFVSPNPLFHTVHLWTISYEAQFYLFAPWFILFFGGSKEKAQRMLLSLLLLGNIVRAILIYQHTPHPMIYVLPVTHFESILAGVALGLGFFDSILNKLKDWMLLLIGITCFGLVINLPNIETIGWHLILTYTLAGIGSVFIVLSVMKERPSPRSNFLYNKYFVKLGKVSYSLYIYHLVCLVIADRIVRLILPITSANYSITMAIIGLILTISFAHISYRWIEKPFLRLKERFAVIPSNPV